MIDPSLIQKIKTLPRESGESDYRLLFRHFQRLILQGHLTGGSRLPASRALAAELKIARNTVKTAYEILIAEGFVETRVGAGSYVVDLSDKLLQKEVDSVDPKRPAPIHLTDYAKQLLALPKLNPTNSLQLQPGVPLLQEFPLNQWKRSLNQATVNASLNASPPAGELRLREQIRHLLLHTRGIEVTSEQILITSGSQQAAFMVAQLLTNVGETVLVETPGFPGTSGVLKAAGCQIKTVDLYKQGALPDGRMINITPSRNFPLGHTLPLERRLEVIHWAETHNSWILEDDYDSEFAAGHPVSALFAISKTERVIYTGTFSRTMFPGLRLGYLVLPQTLVPLFTQARRLFDGTLSVPAQLATAIFIERGYYSRHLKRMREFYKQRQEEILQCISESPLAELPLLSDEGGMHIVLGLPQKIPDHELVSRLAEAGLGIRALSSYALGHKELNGLVIGCNYRNRPDLKKAFALLRSCFDSFSLSD